MMGPVCRDYEQSELVYQQKGVASFSFDDRDRDGSPGRNWKYQGCCANSGDSVYQEFLKNATEEDDGYPAVARAGTGERFFTWRRELFVQHQKNRKRTEQGFDFGRDLCSSAGALVGIGEFDGLRVQGAYCAEDGVKGKTLWYNGCGHVLLEFLGHVPRQKTTAGRLPG